VELDLLTDEALLITAVERAARALRASGPLPPRSEDELRFAVRDQLRDLGMGDVAHEAASITGGWDPLPGRLDLHAPMQRPLRWAAEAKVWDIDQQLWDVFKLTAGIARDDLGVGYLLAAACPTAFAQYGGSELFAAGSREHDGSTLIRDNPREWQHLLNGGVGRPVATPPTVRTTLLCEHWCWFGHRVCLVRVEALAGPDRLTFRDGWPDGFDGAALVAAAKAAPRRRHDDALGLRVPRPWSDAWWRQALRDGVTADQFEAVYGLLLTRRWVDTEIRARVSAPDGFAPSWWI
jgi:hypothetical protein